MLFFRERFPQEVIRILSDQANCLRSQSLGDYAMDKLTHYRQCIKTLLEAQSRHPSNTPDLESQLIFDQEGDHYLWLNVGWVDLEYVYSCFLHFDIKDGKIWIQRNRTETDIAQAWVEMGVPKEDLVLGLHPPYKRPYTGYGMPQLEQININVKSLR